MVQDLQTKVDGYEKGKQSVRALLRDIRAMTARPDSMFDPTAELYTLWRKETTARKGKHRKAGESKAAADELRYRRFHKNLRSAMKDVFATEAERKKMDTTKPEHYTQNSSLQYSIGIRALQKYMEWEGDDTVLDAGCGTGEICMFISQQPGVASVVGFDVSPDFVSYASQQNSSTNILYHVADVSDLSTIKPEWQGAFSKVVSFSVLHWVRDKVTALKALHSCLKPGGEIVMVFATDESKIIPNYLKMAAHPSWDTGLKSVKMMSRWFDPYAVQRDMFSKILCPKSYSKVAIPVSTWMKNYCRNVCSENARNAMGKMLSYVTIVTSQSYMISVRVLRQQLRLKKLDSQPQGSSVQGETCSLNQACVLIRTKPSCVQSNAECACSQPISCASAEPHFNGFSSVSAFRKTRRPRLNAISWFSNAKLPFAVSVEQTAAEPAADGTVEQTAAEPAADGTVEQTAAEPTDRTLEQTSNESADGTLAAHVQPSTCSLGSSTSEQRHEEPASPSAPTALALASCADVAAHGVVG
uniref:Methyltransferase domain-containing protein n=1 Tax=Branchiostoma floridae TaxID=7739 RepID=C3Z9K2_BRAFL|eukprot:XP_002594687.1 hypothetical protein BRAFLDRAFT_130920 [Branchiostoma floridae]